MSARLVVRSLAALALLASVHAGGARAQVLDPIQYQMFPQSHLEYGCFGPCACPVVFTNPVKGSFTFYRTGVDPLYTHYALLNIAWSYTVGDGATQRLVHMTGQGTYDIGGEVASMQRMQLDLVTDGLLAQHFDSGLVPTPVAFPAIEIDVHTNPTACIDSVLHVVAAPFGVATVEPLAGWRLLSGAAPNPTAGSVEMLFAPAAPGPSRVDVLDVRGRVVATVLDRSVEPGSYRLRWNGRDARGADAGPGIFWLRARSGGRSEGVRIVRVR